jgi:hypothetical protein
MSKKRYRVIVELYSMLSASRKNDRFGRVLITETVTYVFEYLLIV